MIAFGELYGYSTEILSPFLVMLFLIPAVCTVFLAPGLSEADSVKARAIDLIVYSLTAYAVPFIIVFIFGYLITGAMPHNVEILKVYSQSNESNFIQVEKLEGCSVKVTSSEESEVDLINGNAVERKLVEVNGKEVFNKVQFFKKGESKIYRFKGIYDCYLTAPWVEINVIKKQALTGEETHRRVKIVQRLDVVQAPKREFQKYFPLSVWSYWERTRCGTQRKSRVSHGTERSLKKGF